MPNNVMSEREAYIQQMLEYEGQFRIRNPRYTLEEDKILYGAAYDYQLASKSHEEGKLSDQDFRAIEDQHNAIMREINTQSLLRRQQQAQG